MGMSHRAEPAENIENRLRDVRVTRGLSQEQLAKSAGITRQAVSSIEANQYLPTTAVALRLTAVLQCRVEDLFNLVSTGEVIDGEWLGSSKSESGQSGSVRVKVAHVGMRTVVRPVSDLGEILASVVPADGLVSPDASLLSRSQGKAKRVPIRLLRDRRVIEHEIAVAGCDPSIVLAGEHLRRQKD
ncbi:helix-turn-helix transcriptional regulator, partial [Petrachloros mirabilis]